MSAHPHEEHHEAAPRRLRWAVVTVSDTRTDETDASGPVLIDALLAAGHEVLERLILPDDMEEIRGSLDMLLRDPELDAIITTGGTGLSPRDVTIEAVTPLLGKTLPGFGELFRALSYESIGTASVLSRATAGTAAAPDANKLLYVLPGSPDACELAVTDLILPEAGHAFAQANRGMDLEGRFAPKPAAGRGPGRKDARA